MTKEAKNKLQSMPMIDGLSYEAKVCGRFDIPGAWSTSPVEAVEKLSASGLLKGIRSDIRVSGWVASRTEGIVSSAPGLSPSIRLSAADCR